MSPDAQYEILLPRTFNDGTPVPVRLFLDTKDDLVRQFGGATFHEEAVTGYWLSDDIEFKDVMVRVTVAARATPENEAFIRQYKEVLKQRFDQKEIWIVEYRVRII
jgi:hypothetical protein